MIYSIITFDGIFIIDIVKFRHKPKIMINYYSLAISYIKDILYQINKYRSILCNTVNIFQTPLSFYATKLVNPFLSSRISANHDKGQGFQPMVKFLYPLMFLQSRISLYHIIFHTLLFRFIRNVSFMLRFIDYQQKYLLYTRKL